MRLFKLLKSKYSNLEDWQKLTFPMIALSGVAAVFMIGGFIALLIAQWLGSPVPVIGYSQEYPQPIEFPHTIHASTGLVDSGGGGEQQMGIGLDCTYCHRTVAKQANAGVPAIELCAYCHAVVGEVDDNDLQQLRLNAGITGESPEPINWRRVHRLPDHVRFAHDPHVQYLTNNPSAIKNATDPNIKSKSVVQPSAVCSTCHGDVASREVVIQVEPLRMGQCVECHKQNNAPTSCEACHY